MELDLPYDPTIPLIDKYQVHSLLSAQNRGKVGQWDMELAEGEGRLNRLLGERLQVGHRPGKIISEAMLTWGNLLPKAAKSVYLLQPI